MLSITQATLEFEYHFGLVWEKHGQANETVQKFIAHKLRHVYGVLDATLRVITTQPELANLDRDFLRKAEVVALRHDIWRFYQVQADRIVGNKEYEHGDGVFRILQEKYPDLVTINLACKIHNKFSHTQLLDEPVYQALSAKDQEEAMLLTKIIRDADKLQNLTYDAFDNFDALYRFDKQIHMWEDDTFWQTHISPAVLEDLITWNMTRHADIKTFPDTILSHYTRLFDINFASTMNQVRQLQFSEKVLQKLKDYGVSEKQLQHIPRLDTLTI